MTATMTPVWVDVCPIGALVPGRGVAALVGDHQVAVFRPAPDAEVFALSNYDPFSKAFVLSRGLVGSTEDTLTVASPVYKQRFDLRTGRSLDDPAVAVPTYVVRLHDGWVQVARP